MSFLTAEWRKLAIANYAIDKSLLTPYLPAGTELDLWEGTCYVSLIGFLFKNVKLLGFSIPFHANFEEVNLRFYVKYKDGENWKRGVVFIKEIVPKFALSVVANTIYNENYETMPMTHSWSESEDDRAVEYRWRCKNQWQSFRLRANKGLSEIPSGSEAEFITEHYWGYARYSDSKTNEYEVRHPKWAQYKVKDFNIDVDFGLVYGDTFDFLNQQEPVSVMLAEGSDISVEGKKVING
ncbi:hypothetical protein SAMN06265348_105169 [Pedobacter westerhofensis]|uniref:DUF2071 domain-containing protein n=1 Tax=Pedobacter westerhofensis TaxID=425512 RepID=A0A521DBF1_9SPHI|nr:DUF2071 domain-containing protein [Pedobacter westerhofensis]SMO68993.1 hypothetical protein SAMN06265348_105169 [Pedobacter westerhofensis]